MTTRSIKNKKINDALFSKFKELEAKINSRNVVNFGKKTNSRSVIKYGTGNNNKTNSNYTPGSNSNNARNASNSERDLRNHVKEIIKTDIALKRKMRKSISLAQLAALKKKKAQGGVQNNGKVVNNNNNVFQNAKNGFNNNNNNIFYNASSSINETWNKMDKIKRLEFPIEQLAKGDPKQEKAMKKVTKLIQGRIDSIIKLYKEKKPIRALRSLASFLLAVAMIGQSITTGKTTANEFVIGPYIRESNLVAGSGFGVPSKDISFIKNLRKIFFQTSVTHSQGVTIGLLTDVTGTGSSIVGFLTTIYAIILSLWISSIGRGEFGTSKGNLVLAQMTRLIHFFNKMVFKELIPSMIKASGERRASEASRYAFIAEYTTKAASLMGGALLKSMLPIPNAASALPLLTQ